MILDEIMFLNKRERMLAHIITGFFSLIFIGAFVFVFYLSERATTYHIIIRVALGILCTASIVDFATLFCRQSSSGYLILRLIKRKHHTHTPLLAIRGKGFQNSLYERLKENSDIIGDTIHIYGLPDRGKTSSSYFALQGVFTNTNNVFSQIKKVVFIDCSSNKNMVINYFESELNRNELFDKCIVILDNIEELGSTFLEINSELIQSKNNLFILIEDTIDDTSVFQRILSGEKIRNYNFSNNILELDKNVMDINKVVLNLTHHNQLIFFSLYISIVVLKYAPVSLVYSLAMTNKRAVYLLLKKKDINRIFMYFPFNEKYICGTNNDIVKEVFRLFQYNEFFQLIITRCVEENVLNAEGKWLCFTKASEDYISNFSTEERLALFNKALLHNRYRYLFNSLSETIDLQNHKASVFRYEYGLLNYYMGNNARAAELFEEHINTLDHEQQMRSMLSIIDSSHGSNSKHTRQQIKQYLTALKKDAHYSIYADYWKVHIESEKGIFQIEELITICNKLQQRDYSKSDPLAIDTIRRCYTDIFRSYHILDIEPLDSIVTGFTNVLEYQNKEMHDYYYSLYAKANNIHYLQIPKFCNEGSSSELWGLINKANSFYVKSELSTYAHEKSKQALIVKKSELNMMYTDADIEKELRIVKNFLVRAEANDIHLFIAYSHTMLGKYKMIGNNPSYGRIDNFYPNEDIVIHLKKAKQIYTDYGNKYGVFRVSFLESLYALFMDSKKNQRCVLKNMKILLRDNSNYSREMRIYSRIEERNDSKNLSKMFLLWTIKSYPIILQ